MRIYFYDNDYRYIGSRELLENEIMPFNATTKPIVLTETQEGYLINNEWTIQEIQQWETE